MEVTDSWGVEFFAAKRSQGGSLSLLILLAVHFLRDRKSSLKSRRAHRQADRHKNKTYLVMLLKPFDHFCFSLLPFILELQSFANRVYILNTVHLNVNIRSVGA